jgi:hypothetical protein
LLLLFGSHFGRSQAETPLISLSKFPDASSDKVEIDRDEVCDKRR